MTDIAKCSDRTCPSSLLCWRFVAPSGKWQSWMAFDRKGGDRCKSFWPVGAPVEAAK